MHLTPKAAPILCFDMLYVYFAFAKAFWALGPGDLRRYAFHVLWYKMEELISKVDRLKELEESFSHSLNEAKEDACTLNQAVGHIVEWIKVKKQIRLATLETSVSFIPGSENKETRTIIQKINLGEKLPFEKIFNGTVFEELFETELNDDEISCLESDVFYSWFSGYDYVKKLYSVGTLIAGVGDLPSSLSMFVDELRLSYVFQRYLAVYALCRAVLDITIRDVYKKNNLDDQKSENYFQVKELISRADPKFRFPKHDPTLYQMIKMLTTLHSYEHLGNTLDDIREKTNPIVHGNIDVHGSKPMEIIRATLQSVHDLYEVKVEIEAQPITSRTQKSRAA